MLYRHYLTGIVIALATFNLLAMTILQKIRNLSPTTPNDMDNISY